MTYISEKGYQDAHTKKWIEQQELDARRERIAGDRKNISKLKEGQEADKGRRILENEAIKQVKRVPILLKDKAKNDIIILPHQLGKKFGKHARDWGLDQSNSEDRDKLVRIIQNILYTDDVRKGPWRGQSGLVKFYVKGDDAVVVNNHGQFVTLLKGGANNARIKNARGKKI